MSHPQKNRFLLLIVLFLPACSPQTRLIPAPVPSPSPSTLASSAGDLAVSVRYVITPDSPGSWVRGAPWDEYVLTITNVSTSPISVGKFRLVDQKGSAVESFSDGSGTPMPPGWFPIREFAAGGAGLGGVAALTNSPLAAGPAGFLGTALFFDARYVAHRNDRAAIQAELTRRRLIPATLQESVSTGGSVFFPIVPSARALAVDYRMGSEAKTVEVPLARPRSAETEKGKSSQ